MPRIKQWDGTGQDAFGTAQIVFKDTDGAMNFIFSQVMHGQIFNGIGQILQGAIGSMGGLDNGFSLLGGQLLVEFLTKVNLIFFGRTQVSFHASDKGPGTFGHMGQIGLTLFRTHTRTVVIGIGHAIQVTGVINVHSPILAGFVPSLIGRVGTKDCVW